MQQRINHKLNMSIECGITLSQNKNLRYIYNHY